MMFFPSKQMVLLFDFHCSFGFIRYASSIKLLLVQVLLLFLPFLEKVTIISNFNSLSVSFEQKLPESKSNLPLVIHKQTALKICPSRNSFLFPRKCLTPTSAWNCLSLALRFDFFRTILRQIAPGKLHRFSPFSLAVQINKKSFPRQQPRHLPAPSVSGNSALQLPFVQYRSLVNLGVFVP